MNNPIREDDPLFSSFEYFLRSTERPEFPIQEHWHYFAEIIRVRTGSLTLCRGGKSYRVNAGDAVFITPLLPHSIDYGEPGVPAEYDVMRMDMEVFGDLPSYAPDMRGLMFEAERRGLPMLIREKELRESHMEFTINACVEEYRRRSYGYDLRIRSLLYLFLTSLIRRWIQAGFVPQNYGSSMDPIYSVPYYISRHIQEPLKVEELAKYCGLSYPWFARKFHQIYGISCKEYIERVRIRRVEHYLQFTDCDLNYISRHTGYADCSHLVRNFRKFRNTTPGQFRQAYRQKTHSNGQFPQNY